MKVDLIPRHILILQNNKSSEGKKKKENMLPKRNDDQAHEMSEDNGIIPSK